MSREVDPRAARNGVAGLRGATAFDIDLTRSWGRRAAVAAVVVVVPPRRGGFTDISEGLGWRVSSRISTPSLHFPAVGTLELTTVRPGIDPAATSESRLRDSGGGGRQPAPAGGTVHRLATAVERAVCTRRELRAPLSWQAVTFSRGRLSPPTL